MTDAIEPLKGRRVYLVLRERIARGTFAPRAQLPGEPRLATEFGVARVTVRRALDRLTRDGLVERRPGAGTFVRERGLAEPMVADLADVFAHLQAMGARTGVRLIAFAYETPPPAVAEAMRLPADARTQRSERVRLIDGEPFSYLTTHVPEGIGSTYTEADLAATPLLALLERSGVVVARASQTISATLAGPDVAGALGVDVGAPLLALTRVVFDANGACVEHLHARYRPDRYAFETELRREGVGAARRWAPTRLSPANTDEAGDASPNAQETRTQETRTRGKGIR